MTEKMYYAYEFDFAGRPCPVVYHGEKPTKRMEGNIERTSFYEVPPECIVNGEPQWGRLSKLYPPPLVKDDET